jgi:hypothetical protein
MIVVTKKERKGLAWFLTWIWKLRVLRGDEMRRVPFAYFLNDKNKQKCREKFMEKKWL